MTKISAFLLLAFTGITGSLQADDKWDIAKVDVSKLPPTAGTAVTAVATVRAARALRVPAR
jgi:hypothetical protein